MRARGAKKKCRCQKVRRRTGGQAAPKPSQPPAYARRLQRGLTHCHPSPSRMPELQRLGPSIQMLRGAFGHAAPLPSQVKPPQPHPRFSGGAAGAGAAGGPPPVLTASRHVGEGWPAMRAPTLKYEFGNGPTVSAHVQPPHMQCHDNNASTQNQRIPPMPVEPPHPSSPPPDTLGGGGVTGGAPNTGADNAGLQGGPHAKKRRVMKRDPNRKAPKMWDEDEIAKFKKMVEEEGSINWESKAQRLGTGRTSKALHT